jgi:competence ComEA-like helix-hairpin-helix protein
VFFIPVLIKKHIKQHSQPYDYSEFIQKVDKIVSKKTDVLNSIKKQVSKQIKKKEYFYFDPNTVSISDLKKMGFTERQSQTLINYRKSGGVFKKKSDLKKIYGITGKLYSNVESYINIKKHESEKPNKKNKVIKSVKIIIDINTADTTELIKLQGIGNVLSKRIIKYRDYLGGFFDKKQLLEVYGIKKETYEKIKNNIIIDTTYIHKIDINKADFKIMVKHPYLSYTDTKRIIKFRELSGNFTNILQLKTNNLVSNETYAKIKHYIIVEHL